MPPSDAADDDPPWDEADLADAIETLALAADARLDTWVLSGASAMTPVRVRHPFAAGEHTDAVELARALADLGLTELRIETLGERGFRVEGVLLQAPAEAADGAALAQLARLAAECGGAYGGPVF